jgi:hypothetical protein
MERENGKSKVENGIEEMDRRFSPILISIFQISNFPAF